MHGDIQKDYYSNRITWRHLTVKVPRCENCKKQHDYQNNSIGYGCGLGLLLGFGGYFIYGWGAVIALAIGGTVVGYINGSARRKTADMGTHNQFHQVKELVKKGWAFGDKPANVN
jgi:hypothetical protein